MERVVLDVVVLQRHHERDERLGRDEHVLKEVSRRKRGVSDARQRPPITHVADTKDVNTPAFNFNETFAQLLLMRCFHSVQRQAFAGKRISMA